MTYKVSDLFKYVAILGVVIAFPSAVSAAQERVSSDAQAVEEVVLEEPVISEIDAAPEVKPKVSMKDVRYELSEKVLEVRPLDQQVERAIQQLTSRMPVQKRERVRTVLRNAMDIEYLEHLSLKVMAELFTEKELKTFIEYYSRPEIQSMEKKMEEFNRRISPSISLMVEEALGEMKKIQGK